MTPPHGGYVWWYVDALSDDGAYGITLIAFLGSVFSPYYAWARRRGGGDPMRHCALNVALYGKRKRWAMTERGAGAVQRGADFLSIGPSALSWDGSGLTIQIEEIAVPMPRRIRGTVRLYPSAVETRVLPLDTAGRHRWQPIAPCARVEVTMDSPNLSWSGPAYFDTNDGDRPLEADFARWDWCRAAVARWHGNHLRRDAARWPDDPGDALRRRRRGGRLSPRPPSPCRRTLWRVPRRISAAATPTVVETLEDTPFYARSVVAAQVLGHQVTAMHESLDDEPLHRPLGPGDAAVPHAPRLNAPCLKVRSPAGRRHHS